MMGLEVTVQCGTIIELKERLDPMVVILTLKYVDASSLFYCPLAS